MRMWFMKEGNAYWNRACKQWTSLMLATQYKDSEVAEIELTGEAHWVRCEFTGDRPTDRVGIGVRGLGGRYV